MAPSLSRDMEVLAENAERLSQLIFTKCVKSETFWLIPAAELKVHMFTQSANIVPNIVPKVYVQAYGLFCIFKSVCTATAEQGRWVCTCVSTADWIVTAER